MLCLNLVYDVHCDDATEFRRSRMKNVNRALFTFDKGVVKKHAWVVTRKQQNITEVSLTKSKLHQGSDQISSSKTRPKSQNTDPKSVSKSTRRDGQKSRSVKQNVGHNRQSQTDNRNAQQVQEETIPHND